ncbi:MAG: hypothetical protein M1837_006518 [Sclerophora amabilis]|nr:MAG: hypothetical protein M1837_006518 [Sclerophora amabilis]
MIADLKADTLRWQSERRDAGSRGAASGTSVRISDQDPGEPDLSPVPYYKSQVHEDRQNYGPTPSNAQFPPPGTGQRNPNPNPNPYPYEDIRTPSSQGSYDPNYGQATSYGPQGTYQSQGYPPDYLPPQGQAETSSYIYTQGANYPVQSGQQPRTAPQYDYPQQMEQVPYPSPIENQNYSQQQPSHRPVPRGGHHSHPHPRDPNNRGGNYY